MAEDGRLRENNVAGEFHVDTLMSLRCIVGGYSTIDVCCIKLLADNGIDGEAFLLLCQCELATRPLY